MMKALDQLSILYYGKKHQLGEIVVDAVIKECHEQRAQATEHPTESGESFCDHVQLLPTTISLEGIISNTHLSFIGIPAIKSLYNFTQGESNDLAERAFEQLEAIFAKREPIAIATSLKDYDNMVLESLSVERSAHTSSSLHFRATAKQIRRVNQATIEIPVPKVERAKPKQNLGKQETKAASMATKEVVKKNQSALSSFRNWASTLWK